jgi:hypothetical protein
MTVAVAQKEEYKELGHVKPQELTMTIYAPDSSAEAVVLEDRGVTNLFRNPERGYYFKYRRYKRIKILKKSALDYANVTIPLNANSAEVITSISARTHNGSSVQELTDDAVFEEKKSKIYSLGKFTLPNVRVGSVIEYSYTILSDNIFLPKDWYFQTEIPVIKSDYVLKIIPGFKYRILSQGFDKMAIDSTNNVMGFITHHWGRDSTTALKEEPYMANIENYRTKLFFELIETNLYGATNHVFARSWDDLDKAIMTDKTFGAAMDKIGFVKDSIKIIKNVTTDTLGQVEAVYDFVRRNMNYNGKETYFIDKTLKDAYQKRSGSAAEINLMLVAMLRELDLPANPVILSTRSNGFLTKEYPLIGKFDYVVAQVEVNGKDMLLDATNKFRKMGVLPLGCLNGEGRLIGAKSRWISLKPTEKMSQVHSASLQIMPNGQYKGQVVQNYGGYSAVETRQAIFEVNQDKFKEMFATINADWKIDKLTIENIENPKESVKIIVDATFGDEKETERLYLNPVVSSQIKSNPFKKTKRMFPIDFGMAQEQVYFASIQLPADYVVEEIPKNTAITLPNGAGRFVYASQIENNILKINTRFSINKTIFEAEEYDMLREFYDKIIAKQAELMVLKKK